MQTGCLPELHPAALRSQTTHGLRHRPQKQASPKPGWAAVGRTTCHCANAPIVGGPLAGSSGRPARRNRLRTNW
eukprot:841956-Alexandrium_andersonii.AAC.1